MTDHHLIETPGARPVGIVGAGLIGLGWTALFVHRGHLVHTHDPDPDVLAGLPQAMETAIAEIEAVDGPRRAGGRLQCFPDLCKAVNGCAYIQENAPERLPLKLRVLAEIAESAPPDAVIGSSTTSFTARELGEGQAKPEHIIVAHPYNPPHLIPLVEIGGAGEDYEPAIAFAWRFFRSLGKEPVHIRLPVRGHIANRLSAALFREAVHIVSEGVASVEDVDRAIVHGPGLRWATAGPFLNYHLGAGRGGLAAYLDHLGPAQEARWADLGDPKLDDETKKLLVSGMNETSGDADITQLSGERAERLAAIRLALAGKD